MSLPPELTEELLRIADDVDAVLEDVVIDSLTNDIFTTHVADNLVFFGKSLAVWDDELAVVLPRGAVAPDEIRALYADVGNNIQIASHFYEQSAAANSISATAVEVKKADLVTALVAHYHSQGTKPPPSGILDKMADGYTKRLSSLGNTSKIVRSFWKGKLNMLIEIKSILNSIAISSAIEMKHAGGDD